MSKTRTQDDTIVIGESHTDRSWLNSLLSPLLLGLTPTGSVFPFGPDRLRKWFESAAVQLDMSSAKFVPHMLRHGGPSMDSLAGYPLQEIQRRGQWAAIKSVLRYSKHGRYLRILHGLPLAVRSASAGNIQTLKRELPSLIRKARRS